LNHLLGGLNTDGEDGGVLLGEGSLSLVDSSNDEDNQNKDNSTNDATDLAAVVVGANDSVHVGDGVLIVIIVVVVIIVIGVNIDKCDLSGLGLLIDDVVLAVHDVGSQDGEGILVGGGKLQVDAVQLGACGGGGAGVGGAGSVLGSLAQDLINDSGGSSLNGDDLDLPRVDPQD
jgi:hypothetical protein